ncbi:hypothetical protein ACFYU9_16000 [Streptomyces sp. NPDC004327]|uniref:hypothetical protein n=2 Tax=unclassified Streptomyces TaxID=2593676 RepID=UPI0036762021
MRSTSAAVSLGLAAPDDDRPEARMPASTTTPPSGTCASGQLLSGGEPPQARQCARRHPVVPAQSGDGLVPGEDQVLS